MKKIHVFFGLLIVIVLVIVITLLVNNSSGNSNPTAAVLNTVGGTKNIQTTDSRVPSSNNTNQRLGPGERCMQTYNQCSANETQELNNCVFAVDNSQPTYTQYTPGHDPQEIPSPPPDTGYQRCLDNYNHGVALCIINYDRCLLDAELITIKHYLEVSIPQYLDAIGIANND